MELKILRSLAEISSHEWQALCSPSFPFNDFDHLLALEATQCVGASAGWLPFYLALFENESLIGATYFYIKNNSYGEFIFDFAWAQAYARNGLHYYPKIVSSVPFTPATGEKLLIHPKADKNFVQKLFIEKIREISKEFKCSSTHFLFLPKENLQPYKNANLLIRHSFQYHWKNKGYGNFDDFLQSLTSKRRRQIQLERRQLSETGTIIKTYTGSALTQELAQLMYELYFDTNEKMRSHACLNLEFFQMIFKTMADRIVLFVAEQDEKPIAAAINFKKGDAMYGRYWGCYKDVRNLHFELCYYQAIEYSILNKINLYEAGAQGEHKFPRAFLPELTYSAHEIEHPQFRDAIANFIEDEKLGLAQMFEEYKQHSPYK